jgi:hypothetical protein
MGALGALAVFDRRAKLPTISLMPSRSAIIPAIAMITPQHRG